MNLCEGCGLCCMETEMLVSKKDLSLILSVIKSNVKEADFFNLNPDGLYQLKNVDGHCIFLDPVNKECTIYKSRPAGCRFYPIVYDSQKHKCVYDKDCPRIQSFRLPAKSFQKVCKKIINYLREECKISF